MRRLLPFILLIALAGCNQGPKGKYETRLEGHKPKALIAERVEGQSPWKVDLRMQPEEPRSNAETRFQFVVEDEKRQPVRDAQVHVSLVMPLMDMGKNDFDAKETAAPGVYDATGKFTMGDEWEVIVTVTKDGKTGKHIFNVRVQE